MVSRYLTKNLHKPEEVRGLLWKRLLIPGILIMSMFATSCTLAGRLHVHKQELPATPSLKNEPPPRPIEKLDCYWTVWYETNCSNVT